MRGVFAMLGLVLVALAAVALWSCSPADTDDPRGVTDVADAETGHDAQAAASAVSTRTVVGGLARDGEPEPPTPAPTPVVDAPDTVTFPVRVSDDRRYLVDAQDRPFLIHGEAAWSLLAELRQEEVEHYAGDRRARGVNALVVNLVEHFWSSHPPANAYGEQPFAPGADLVTPNEAYFRRVDTALATLRDHEMLVFLFPAYLGYGGDDQGWFAAMSGLTEAQCRDYGRYVGSRYGSLPNIVWMAGGDFSPPEGSAGERCMYAIMEGIRETDPDALMSGHWNPWTTTLDQQAFRPLMDLNGVYTYGLTYQGCDDGREQTDAMPVFLFETAYENEHGTGAAELRAQWYWANTSCGAGFISGNRPIWLFDDGWETALESPGSRHLAVAARIWRGLPWWELRPDTQVVVSGGGAYGSEEWVSAARSVDGRTAVIYLPPSESGARTISVALGRLEGTVQASFYDPASGDEIALGEFAAAGTRAFTTPGSNSAGDGDWLLVLRVR